MRRTQPAVDGFEDIERGPQAEEFWWPLEDNAGDPGLIPGLEDPLEKEMATHSSILARRIPRKEEPGTIHRVAKSWI